MDLVVRVNCWILAVLILQAPRCFAQTGELTFNTGDNGYFVRINQNIRMGEHLLQAECNSSDPAYSSITYSILHEEQLYFEIDEHSGNVTIRIDAIDLPHESLDYSAVMLCTTDGNQRPGTTTLTVRYVQENEYQPVFDNNTMEIWIDESRDITENPYVTALHATDEDSGHFGTISYRIVYGNREQHRFRINNTTGVITLSASLNYERTQNYSLTIWASNPPTDESERAVHATATVQIYVRDVNDEPPRFSQNSYDFNFTEGIQPENFAQLSCSDPDTHPDDIIYRRLFQQWPFMVDLNSGNVSAKDTLDYEQATSYALHFECIDLSVSNCSINAHDCPSDTVTINIGLLPVNEFRPERIGSSSAVIRISEDTTPGTLIASGLPNTDASFTLQFVDMDRGLDHGNFEYTYSDNTDMDTVMAHFHLDAQTGNLTLTTPFDLSECSRDEPGTPRLVRIGITACDISATDKCPNMILRIFIIPSDCVLTFENKSIVVNETVAVGSVLETIPCEIQGGKEGIVNIRMVSSNSDTASTFQINKTGALTLQRPLDYEERQKFSFLLLCVDVREQEAVAFIEIHVLPENDNHPYFENTLYIYNVSNPTTPHVIGEVEATDKDIDFGNSLYYTIRPSYHFSISQNGTLILDNLPATDPQVHPFILQVEATDGQFTATTTVLVLINTEQELRSSNCTIDQGKDSDAGLFIAIGILTILILPLAVGLVVAVVWIYNMQQLKGRKGGIEERDASTERDLRLKGPVTMSCPAYTSSHEYSTPYEKSGPYHYVTTTQLYYDGQIANTGPGVHVEVSREAVPPPPAHHTSTAIDSEDYIHMQSAQQTNEGGSQQIGQMEPSGDTDVDEVPISPVPSEYELPQTTKENIYERIQ